MVQKSDTKFRSYLDGEITGIVLVDKGSDRSHEDDDQQDEHQGGNISQGSFLEKDLVNDGG